MAFQGDSIFWVEVEKVVENPFQPRREFDESKLKELAESIRMYGILQPLTVTRQEIQTEDGAFRSEYELIAGERRLRASKLAGLAQVPVIIRSGEQTEQEKLELAIIENLQREDLNAVDRALAFRQLADTFELSHAQVAKKVGRSREYVSNSIRLLGLPECMLNSLKLGDISEGHARTLLMLRDRPEEQDVVYREILLKKLSVREVERITRKIASDKVRKKKWTNTDAELIAIEKEFTDTLGTRVQISKTDFGGKLTIDYFSDEDLQKLLAIMKQQEEDAQKAVEEGESATVIHELSPEASLAAKLSQAVPLDMVAPEQEQEIASPEMPQAADEGRHSIPQQEDVPFGTSHAESVVEEVSAEATAVSPDPEGVSEQPVADTDDEFAFMAQEQAAPTVPEPEQQESLQTDIEEASAVPVTQQEEGGITEEPDTPSAEPAVDSSASQHDYAKDDEFAFVAQHTDAARKEDLVSPYENAETEVAETTATVTESEPEIPEEKANDEDLYSMKNFTL